MLYNDYNEIPANLRRVILDETLEKRINKVPLSLCNRIIDDYERHEAEMETLRHFSVQYKKGSVTKTFEYTSGQEALTALDQMIGYDDRDLSVVAVLKQADRVIRGYFNGQWIVPAPKDAVKFNKVGV
jgi:hypothetical protein|tara:strand:- start:90 stop:473 length:384 start_codon:yes stop_codon:yes gene_type:complete